MWMEIGFDDYLTKPFSHPASWLARIRHRDCGGTKGAALNEGGKRDCPCTYSLCQSYELNLARAAGKVEIRHGFRTTMGSSIY